MTLDARLKRRPTLLECSRMHTSSIKTTADLPVFAAAHVPRTLSSYSDLLDNRTVPVGNITTLECALFGQGPTLSSLDRLWRYELSELAAVSDRESSMG